MARSRRMRRRLLLSALVVASALVLRPAAAAAQPLPRLPKMVWELYLQEECQACGVAYGIYARLPEADRARLHAGTKIPLDASTLTRGQTRVVTAWFNSTRWGCDPPAEQLDADSVRRSTLVFKCEDGVVEFCLQSPEQDLWKKLTIACAPARAEWVRDGLPLLPFWYTTGWEGGTRPPVPPKDNPYFVYRQSRDLHGAYASLPVDVLRRLHQGTDVSRPFAELPAPVRERIVAAWDRETRMHNGIAGWPEETLRTPELRARHFGIVSVDFTYRRAHPDYHYGETSLHSVPRPYRTVFLQLHFSPWMVKEKLKYWVEFGENGVGYANLSPIRRVAVPAEVQCRLCAWTKARHEWREEWMEEIPGHPGAKQGKPGAPPRPKPWP